MEILVNFVVMFFLWIIFLFAVFLITSLFLVEANMKEKAQTKIACAVLLFATAAYWLVALYSIFGGK
jgi:hypothetical protein